MTTRPTATPADLRSAILAYVAETTSGPAWSRMPSRFLGDTQWRTSLMRAIGSFGDTPLEHVLRSLNNSLGCLDTGCYDIPPIVTAALKATLSDSATAAATPLPATAAELRTRILAAADVIVTVKGDAVFPSTSGIAILLAVTHTSSYPPTPLDRTLSRIRNAASDIDSGAITIPGPQIEALRATPSTPT